MLSQFDRKHIGEILSDDSTRFNWMEAYVLRFLDKAIGKGARELPQLYKIYPQEMEALLAYYGFSPTEIGNRVREWSIGV